ncbi:hypothetical protein EJ02DRAFT_331136, partial [Clathrospora elynae]
SITGLKIVNEGEKNKDENVMEAGHQKCNECDGKVVWATKGEYLMICEGCGEP